MTAAVDRERVQRLMMAALDGECTPEERRELNALLASHAELSAEWAQLRRVREVMSGVSLRRPPEETWDAFRTSILHRAERAVAWTLIAAGLAVLGVWGGWEWLERFLGEAAVPPLIKGAVIVLVAGGVLLLASVIRERWFLRRRDPYSREVIR